MKTTKLLLFNLIFITFLVITFTSCEKEESTPSGEFYSSLKKVKQYTHKQANDLFVAFTIGNPAYSSIVQNCKYDVEVYEIIYTTTYKNANIEASALVCIPKGVTEALPILSFQNGTITNNNQAPTQNLQQFEFQAVHSLASLGYIVVMPDFIGFGKSAGRVPPYMHYESNTNSVIDLVKAVKEASTNKDLSSAFNNDLYLLGYSFGGWLTLATHREIELKHTEYKVVASACGAGPYSLTAVKDYMLSVENYPQPYYLAYVFQSFSGLGIINTPSAELFKEPYASRVPTLFTDVNATNDINSQLTQKVADLITDNYIKNSETAPVFNAMSQAMKGNSIEAWLTQSRIRFYHGTDDDNIPPSLSVNMHKAMIDKGNAAEKIEYFSLPGDHTTAAIPALLSSIAWFTELKK